MRKLFILIIVILVNISAFAQRKKAVCTQPVNSVAETNHSATAARTSSIGDTLILSNINPLDTLTIYLSDASDTGGYTTGTNLWNDIAFAELYNINDNDSSVVILGMLAEFAGKVNPASTQMVTFTIWNQGSAQIISTGTSYNGFPENILDTGSEFITMLGIGTTKDTLKEYLFPTPVISSGSFFAGYSISYNYDALNGDTIGLACSKNGDRIGDSFTVQQEIDDLGNIVNDTVINVQNATLGYDYNWYDNYTQNDSLYNNLAIFPIVAIVSPSGIKGVTRNNLTFFGNYPNPASDNTNIKFSLATTTDISIQIMDMQGRTLNSINQSNLAAGTHIIPVNTATMPSGDYLYLVRTSGGDGLAGKMTVIH